MPRRWLAMGGVVTLLGSGLIVSMARAHPGNDPTAVIAAYEEARTRRDFDAALTYFADDARISVRTTSYSGKGEIRKFLENPSRSRTVVVSDRHASGSSVTWTERATSLTTGPQHTTSAQAGPSGNVVVNHIEAVVQDGRIRSLAYQAVNQPGRTDGVLDGRAPLPASVGSAMVLSVMFGALMVASVGLRRSASPSSLHGRLMHGLRGWSAARH